MSDPLLSPRRRSPRSAHRRRGAALGRRSVRRRSAVPPCPAPPLARSRSAAEDVVDNPFLSGLHRRKTAVGRSLVAGGVTIVAIAAVLAATALVASRLFAR